ncbi:MAG: rhamnulokinase [Verrucomicrobia bacterium]|nr:MAG: rhamnulokinase [Verrucomicrobiota bacterium]
MERQVYLGVDVGAESGRVMAGLWDGRRMDLAEVARFANGPVEIGGTLRWDPLRLWAEIRAGLAQASSRFGSAVVSVGVDTWALDYVLMSRSGEMLGLPFCYRDPSHRAAFHAASARVPRAEVFGRSGVQFMPINTLYQWIARHGRSPEVFAAAERFLMMPDWLNWCLCGSDTVEFTNATTTQFLDPVARRWSTELLERFGLPTHLLPGLVEPGTRLGPLRAEVAGSTGLGRVPVVAPATHDTGSAVVGVPSERTGHRDWAYISSGTWSLVGYEAAAPELSARALALNATNEGGVDGTWRVLKNVMGLWLVQRCRASFASHGGTSDYGALVAMAEGSPGLRSLVDPDDERFLNPPDMPSAIRDYCVETRQPVPATEAELVRCALDSLALKYASVLGQLEELAGTRFVVVHIVGGGARNGLLNQATADATGRPVLAGPTEATALGNLVWQARALGELDSLVGAREVVRSSSEVVRFEPRHDAAGRWAEARERFASLCGPRA